MRNLHCNGYKWDKKYLIALLVILFCSIICGIVLYKPVISNSYFIDLADEYVFNVFCFRNFALFLHRFLSDLIYLYIIFFIALFTKLKYLTLIFVFLKGLFFGVYVAVLFGITSFGGGIVCVFVFIPSSLVSFAMMYVVAEYIKIINKRYVFFVPLVLSLIGCVIYELLINVVFRLIIAIV